MNYNFEISDETVKRFELALQLTGENKDIVGESLLKAYIIQSFSGAASSYKKENEGVKESFAKAVHKIPKWASKPSVVPSKIIRAFLLLEEELGKVTYSDLLLRCSDKEKYPKEYVPTFANNFAQMKFDDEKSHGKVFEVDEEQNVKIWEKVKEIIKMNENNFKFASTDVGFINDNNQLNLGRTEKRGTNPTNWLYKMLCRECGHEYHANGSDIHLKKCPSCQGGADTGNN